MELATFRLHLLKVEQTCDWLSVWTARDVPSPKQDDVRCSIGEHLCLLPLLRFFHLGAFHRGLDITATPAISNGVIYFPCWNGNLYAITAKDGLLVWEQNLTQLLNIKTTGYINKVNVTVARATPSIAGDLLIVGLFGPAVIFAVKRDSGHLVWKTKLDIHSRGVITMSGTAYKDGFYIGVSSKEESLPIEQCCTFIGSFAKVQVSTGEILWQTYMLPDNEGKLGNYSGVAVWGSSPSIDPKRNSAYIATGNLYTAPPMIRKCQAEQNRKTKPDSPDPCIVSGNHLNSILSLDLDTGKIKWATQLGGYDAWFIACKNLSTPNCPPGPNPDADFGEAPMFLSVNIDGKLKDIVVAGQKTGSVWALNCDDGSIVWETVAGPGGPGGGGNFGMATDGQRVYTNIVNNKHLNFTLIPDGVTLGGGWVGMDASTGKVLWSTADPVNGTDYGPVTVANGVLFVGSVNEAGPVYALNALTGRILWQAFTNATVYGGFSVLDGCAYVGSGYSVNSGSGKNFTRGDSLHAYCIPGTVNSSEP
ncbi:hypothetical protein KP509_01G118300 [Ceratopteris richardii]|uniref:Pyrrolo-quinoline quinone repeat domain-containing protein n=1 Tax=Ceratopteris richardii TaxID=49495 RepID=A0A8T2VK59_CERRI|nr:hypothetical protein KP509_01G118300 [Ceratopteris richardii]